MPDFDTSVPHIARVYDYWLGGKDNFAADRELGERTLQAYPNLVFSVRANRAFLARAVRFLAAEAGIRQFLDIGTGIPTANNTHEVAQRIAPESRIVYVDNDPIVLSHAKALLKSSPEGACDYLDADLRDPEEILADAARTLDFAQPVAVMLMTVMQFVPRRPGQRDRRPADGGVRAGQLRGDLPCGQRHRHRPANRDGPADERVRGAEGDDARPGGCDPPVRGARAGRARRGPGPGVAPGLQTRGGQPRGALGRRGPKP